MEKITNELLIKLTEVYNSLKEGADCESVLTFLKSTNIISVIDSLQNAQSLNNLEVEVLEKIVLILQFIYNNDGSESIISDDRYDILHEKLTDYTGKNHIGSSVLVNRKTAKHKFPELRGTLEKVYWLRQSDKEDNRKSLEEWMRSIENKLKQSIFSHPTDLNLVYILPKWDGVSLILECNESGVIERALTRGDVETNEAVDLSYLFKGIQMPVDEIELNGKPFAIKTEVVINEENFNKAKRGIYPFKTKRSAVSGILNNQDLQRDEVLPLLTLKLLQVQELGSESQIHQMLLNEHNGYQAIHLTYDNLEEVNKVIQERKNELSSCGFDFDGIVIRFVNADLRARLGRDNHINNYEVAFKFPAPEGFATLLDVDFQYGLLGAVTPVAKITPILLNGKTVSNISLGSIDRYQTLGLRYGDTVIIKYDIIPYLVPYTHTEEELIPIPTHCKYCGEVLTKEPVLGCYNDDCVVNHVGRLLNYITKMRIPNIGPSAVSTFVEEGILTDIPSLYRLSDHKKEIVNMKGYGLKSYTSMIQAIDSRREVFDYELLGSLGIRSIGRKIFKKILSIYYIGELIEICENNKLNKLLMEGVKEETATKILQGIQKNINTIKLLCSELNVKATKDFVKPVNENAIHVCFTKVRDKEFEKYLISKGVVVVDKYNKRVDILICKDPLEDSSKIKRAKKDEKEIVSLTQAYQLFKYDKL